MKATDDDLDQLARNLHEIMRLLERARARGGPLAQGFVLGLDAGMVLGKIEAELKRREKLQ